MFDLGFPGDANWHRARDLSITATQGTLGLPLQALAGGDARRRRPEEHWGV